MGKTLTVAIATATTVLMCGLVVFAIAAAAQDYDIVITNGRVMDPETRSRN